MTSTYKFTLAAVIVFCIAAAFYVQYRSGTPLGEFLGQAKPATESRSMPGQETSGADVPARPLVAAPAHPDYQERQPDIQLLPGDDKNLTRYDFDDLHRTMDLIDQKQRNALLEDEETFRNFVKKEAVNKSVYAAAHANKIDQNDKNLQIARRGAENILREIYLKKLIASKMPPDFPTEEQVRTYYETNKDKFVLEERMPVWQIFLPITTDMTQKDVEILKKQAESIISDISKNKIEFATAALRYSGHLESKFNGGFMGLVKTSEMKPDIKNALLSLPNDKISSPISTGDGLHILKRGPLIARQELQLNDVQEQIKKLLVKQAHNELRQAVFKQAAISYPVELDDQQIERWRRKLQSISEPMQHTQAE